MADYQKYSVPADEWVEFVKTWSYPVLPSGTTDEVAKRRINQWRVESLTGTLASPGQLLSDSTSQRMNSSLANG